MSPQFYVDGFVGKKRQIVFQGAIEHHKMRMSLTVFPHEETVGAIKAQAFVVAVEALPKKRSGDRHAAIDGVAMAGWFQPAARLFPAKAFPAINSRRAHNVFP